MPIRISYRVQWWIVFALALTPLVWLGVQVLSGGLGANPIEAINRFLGDWALRMLLVALAATPVKVLTGWVWPVRMRRMLGLFAFAYVCLHMTSYIVLDQFFDWTAIWQDIVKRKYMTVGMATFVLLGSLAVTSTSGWIKRLGAKRWKLLHKAVYLAGVLGCLHYLLMVKADLLLPTVHAAVLAVLFGVRAWTKVKAHR